MSRVSKRVVKALTSVDGWVTAVGRNCCVGRSQVALAADVRRENLAADVRLENLAADVRRENEVGQTRTGDDARDENPTPGAVRPRA